MVILGSLTIWMGFYNLGWLPPPPQKAVLVQLHPTRLPGSSNSPSISAPHLHHHHHQ